MKNSRHSVSVVIPVLNESGMIQKVFDAVTAAIKGLNIPYEIIFVDDGSIDDSWMKIKALGIMDERVRGVHFTRNYGKESAIAAGLRAASGDACITMDGDLEHPPSLIPEMIREWQENLDVFVVQAVKKDRSYLSPMYRFVSSIYYGLFKLVCKTDMRNQTDFKLIDRSVRDTYVQLPERNLFYRGMISWFGYPTKEIYFEVKTQRRKSHWALCALFRFSINTIASFSGSPLYAIAGMGGFFILLGLVLGIIALYQYFAHIAVSGFTTTILLILIQGGLMLLSLSLIGLYVMKVFDEAKARPRYTILDTVNIETKNDED